MREIKFRAWDTERKKWVGPNLHMEIVSGLLFWQFGFNCNLMGMDSNYGRDVYILQQYTGIKDKNGKEIYEGDILLADKKWMLEVRFRDACFIWFNLQNYLWRPMYDYHSSRLEIIGNIYENPELLKGVKK